MKFWKKISILLCLILGSISFSQAAGSGMADPITDPWDSSNPLAIKTGKAQQILPKAFAQYAPSGSFINRVGMGSASTPPNASAVDTIISGLVSASSGKSEISKGIWIFAMALVSFGVMLSGFITFKAISAGKETPGLGSLKWLGKTLICFIMVNYVASAIPRTLIAICDDIADTAGEWVSQDNVELNAIDTIGRRITNGYDIQFTKWILEIAKRAHYYYPVGTDDRTTMMAALASVKQQSGEAFAKARVDILKLATESNPDSDAETISAKVSDRAKVALGESAQAMEDTMKTAFDSIGQMDPVVRGNILGRSTVDLSGLAYPVQIIRTTIYISTVYITISIWSMPIAILIWAGIFSLPSQWGMNNILYSGVKTILTVILTMILVMVYTAGTLSAETERSKRMEMSDVLKVGGGLELIKRFVLASDTKLGSLANLMTGTTTDLLIASMLIFTAPAQAAAIIKGTNGIAESAKQSMMAGGSGYGLKQSLGFGMGGGGGASTQASGSSGFGGGTPSLGDFQRNMGGK